MDDGRVMVGEAGGREGDGWWRKEVTEKRSCCEGSADQATRHPTPMLQTEIGSVSAASTSLLRVCKMSVRTSLIFQNCHMT